LRAEACRWTSSAGRWYQAGGCRARNLVERSVISASRPFIEDHLQAHALPNVTIETGVNVVELICDGGRVCGVQLKQDDVEQSLDADFVVDCSGRASSATHWLEEIGYPSPEIVEVHCTRYATLTLRRHPDDLGRDVRRNPRVAASRQAPVRAADRGRPLDHDHRFQLRCGSSERLRQVPRRRRDAAIVRAARPVVARRTAH
jgi:2-polyprenyl-6-methoxyphenol hydroxylase-like FAD-dependent oxidoreductase